MRRTAFAAVAAAMLCLFPVLANAQGKQAWEEYDRLIDSRGSVAALTADGVFGDSVDLYSGSLSFSVTDVAVPGNNRLPVAVTRKLTVSNREGYPDYAGGFADWEIDIPHVSGVFAPTWHDNRCDVAAPPAAVGIVLADEFWAGNQADMPGGGEMLSVTTTWPKPSTGGPYKWVTAGNTYFSCLASIDNGTGQGFLAIASDGTRYWFNHMASTGEPQYTYRSIDYAPDVQPFSYTVSRNRVALYATRVEDRFGNWVTYTYSNTATQPLKVTQISSSDGRAITLQYGTNGFISSVSDGTHTWSYGYVGDSLSSVTLPDASKWQFSLAALSHAEIQYSTGDPRTCFSLGTVISGDASGTITHPSGAVGTFVVGPVRFGRTNVPAVCRNYTGNLSNIYDANGQNDDYFVVPVRAVSLALKSRQLTGPGLTAGLRSYAWAGSVGSWQYPPGENHPICTQSNCLDPVCLSDDCAGARGVTVTEPDGSWTRYIYGNSYRYNEGKLLNTQTGSGTMLLKAVFNDYNFATSGQAYSAKLGSSPQPRGAGFTSEYPRPLVSTITAQDGADFIWMVDQGCTATGVYCFDAFARPTRVIKSGSVASPMPGTSLALPPSGIATLTSPAASATGSYTVSWSAITNATRYELQEQLGAGNWNLIHNAAGTSKAIAGKSDGLWSYRVRACNATGCAGWSATKSVEVAIPPSGVPTVTSPATNNSGGYTVSWTPVSGATRYELDERKDGGAWATIHDAGGTSQERWAQATATYEYRARGCNAAGCAGYSTIVGTTVTSPLPAPTLSAPATAMAYENYTVSWTSVATANRYVLERNRNGIGWVIAYDGSGTSMIEQQSIGANYDYRVQACGANGCSPYSATKRVVVEGSVNAPAPTPPEESGI